MTTEIIKKKTYTQLRNEAICQNMVVLFFCIAKINKLINDTNVYYELFDRRNTISGSIDLDG